MSGILIVGLGKLGPGSGGGGGATNLSYTASPTNGVVTSDTGTDATVPLSDGTNAGLMAPAQHTKLAGIESGATADMTAAEILAALLTVDGTGSGLDADLLDGQSSAAFAPSNVVTTHVAATDPHGDRAYTDAQIAAMLTSAFDFKASVKAATTANITLSGAQTIDGVSVVAGDRVLVKDQSTGSQNGIYIAAAGAWARSTDADASAEVTAGLAVPVELGTANGGRLFMLTTSGTITLGSTALTFTRIDAGTLVAANNLSDLTNAATARSNLGANDASNLNAGTVAAARLPASSDTASGIVELATTAETTTGTDTTRAVTPAGLLNATTASNINARIGVEKAGSLVGTRRRINFIDGTNVTITVTDDGPNEEVDVTIAASGGGSGAPANAILVRSGGTLWHYPRLATPTGTAWPTVNRLYLTPIVFPSACTVTALAMNQTAAGTAGNVIRMGLYASDATTLLPTTILDQGTATADSVASKTVTFGSGVSVSAGLYWVACGPQGSTSGGSAWLSAYADAGQVPNFTDSGASWSGTLNAGVSGYITNSTTLTSSPSVTFEITSRTPYVAVRIS